VTNPAPKLVRDWAGAMRPMPTPSDALHKIATYHDGLIELWAMRTKRGKPWFAVVYGLLCKDYLTYGQASEELGQCLMHALACDGLIVAG